MKVMDKLAPVKQRQSQTNQSYHGLTQTWQVKSGKENG